MSQRKPYNPNTKYGRKKMREAHYAYRASLPPEERKSAEASDAVWSFVIIVVVAFVIFLIGGSDALLKWLKH